jgi:hypothetical protein
MHQFNLHMNIVDDHAINKFLFNVRGVSKIGLLFRRATRNMWANSIFAIGVVKFKK